METEKDMAMMHQTLHYLEQDTPAKLFRLRSLQWAEQPALRNPEMEHLRHAR